MPQTDSQTMMIRLPVEAVRALKELRKSKNLATEGSAFKYFVEQEIQAGQNSRLIKIEETLDKLLAVVDRLAKNHLRVCRGMDALASGLKKM